MDRPPEESEVLSAIAKMNNWRSGDDAKIPGEFYKALCKGYGKEDTPETTNVCVAALVSMYQEFWETGSYPGEDEISRRISEEEERSKRVKFCVSKKLQGKGWGLKWQQMNPKQENGKSYSRYEAYKTATDYESFIELGLAHFAAVGEHHDE